MKNNEIVLRRKWFNPLYFIVEKLMDDPQVRTILVYGGKSSAKTVSLCQNLARAAVFNRHNSLAYRKESNRIDTTLKKSFSKAVDSMFLNPLVRKMDRSYRVDNGAEIVMQGLDNEEKAKGIESFRYVLLDELNQFTIGEYEQFQMSLRGMPGMKLFGTWNPVDERSWVKTDLVDTIEWTKTSKYGILPSPKSSVKVSQDGKTVLIKTVYTDNFWIVGAPCRTYGFRDENLIHYYEVSLKKANYNAYRVNVLGEWGKTTYGGEFLKQWRTEKHTGLHPYIPGNAVYLIFDENTVPYFPCAVFQIKEDTGSNRAEAFQVAEFALKNPDNTTKAMGREITRKLLEWGHNEAVFIGGDATSVRDDVKQEKGHNLFKLMSMELAQFRPRLIVPKSNPSVVTSALFVNSILENEIEDICFRVDDNCNTSIVDYENTKEDKNGKVDKKTVTDPKTRQSYQPFGHFCDIVRYFFCTVFSDRFRKFEKGAEKRPVTMGRNLAKHSW